MDEPHEPRSGRVPARLERLFSELLKEQPTRYARRYVRESALVVMTLLLAPESGCGEALAHLLVADDSAFFGALHDDLVLRVRKWRAGTFAIARQEAREELIGAQTMRLLSAVSPREAIEEAYDQLLRMIPQLSKDNEALITLIKKRGRSKADLQNLRAQRESLEPSDLATAMDAAIVAVGCAYANHPINKLRQGRLVPARFDIRQVNIEAPRRNP